MIDVTYGFCLDSRTTKGVFINTLVGGLKKWNLNHQILSLKDGFNLFDPIFQWLKKVDPSPRSVAGNMIYHMTPSF